MLRHWFCCRLLAAALLLAAPTGASAAAAGSAPTEADLERAFEAVLADPADLEAALEYARIAAALGDYEAAASSLERMLMFNPALWQATVELGVLYFQLGSYQTAKSYMEQALDHEEITAAARERVETYLAEIDRQLSPHRLAFSLTGGLRYQTNANLAPGGTILSGGTPVTLPTQFSAEDDFSVFASVRAAHQYDFGTADGDRLETNASAYTSRQFEVEEFSLTFLEADAGPRLVFPGTGGVSVRPYVKGSALFLEQQYYQGVLGGGVGLRAPLSRALTFELDGFWQYAAHTDSAERPTAEDLDGQEARIAAELAYRTGGSGIAVRGEAANIMARQSFEAFQEYSASAYAWLELPAPVAIAGGGLGWTVTLSGEVLRRNYEAADPAISANVRNDTEYRVDGQLIIPVAVSASVFLGAGWQDVRSNLPNYTFDNFTALTGFNVRF